jgi:hypothetical protein
MAPEAKTIKVTEDVGLSDVFDVAKNTPVRLEKDGVIYRLVREDEDIWAAYDPDRVLAGINAAAGAITPEEADRWKEAVYRGREEGTRPITRP